MTQQNQISKRQKEEKLIARRNSYVSYIKKYPLFSTLLVLEEYENSEMYEECAIIRDAIKEYQLEYGSKLPKGLSFPTSVEAYRAKAHQDMMKNFNIVVEESAAKEKAKLIKLNLPVKDGL